MPPPSIVTKHLNSLVTIVDLKRGVFNQNGQELLVVVDSNGQRYFFIAPTAESQSLVINDSGEIINGQYPTQSDLLGLNLSNINSDIPSAINALWWVHKYWGFSIDWEGWIWGSSNGPVELGGESYCHSRGFFAVSSTTGGLGLYAYDGLSILPDDTYGLLNCNFNGVIPRDDGPYIEVGSLSQEEPFSADYANDYLAMIAGVPEEVFQ